MDRELRVIISGGGTGGHIFPAISIANAIKSEDRRIRKAASKMARMDTYVHFVPFPY